MLNVPILRDTVTLIRVHITDVDSSDIFSS